MEKEKRQFGRRDFLKMVGVSGAVGGAALAASSVAPKKAKAELDNPHSKGLSIAVKYLDQPNYDLPPYADGSKLHRISARRTAFGTPAIHEKYGTFGDLYRHETEKAAANVPGWSLRDIALSEAGWASDNAISLDWGGENWGNPFQGAVDANGPWDRGPEQNALTVKKAAAVLGAAATGICELHERWLYSEVQYIDADKPNKREKIIPRKCNNAVVMLVPLDSEMAKFQPTGYNPNGRGYSRMSEVVCKVGEFIRMLGWEAIPCGNDTALSIPFALDAGLGELGRHGLLISPEYGTSCKIIKVFTDMPLAHDKSISFGAAEFCKTCGKCADTCPSKSISKDPEPSYTMYGTTSIEGMKKWYVNTDTCYGYWMQNGVMGCNVCAHVCTYSKPQTWVHDVIKVTTSKTTLFNSIFAKMDDAFGYGAIIDEKHTADIIEEWWNDPSFTRQYDWERHTF